MAEDDHGGRIVRIGELAGKAGVSVRALRYYEEQSLLVSERSPSGQRHYPEAAADRVQLIQLLYSAGLSSRTIAELLPCVETPHKVTPATLALLSAERDRIAEQIGHLRRSHAKLTEVIDVAGSGCRADA
jgi:DNA-binding transcriptional MerR regulator